MRPGADGHAVAEIVYDPRFKDRRLLKNAAHHRTGQNLVQVERCLVGRFLECHEELLECAVHFAPLVAQIGGDLKDAENDAQGNGNKYGNARLFGGQAAR